MVSLGQVKSHCHQDMQDDIDILVAATDVLYLWAPLVADETWEAQGLGVGSIKIHFHQLVAKKHSNTQIQTVVEPELEPDNLLMLYLAWTTVLLQSWGPDVITTMFGAALAPQLGESIAGGWPRPAQKQQMCKKLQLTSRSMKI